MIIVPKTDEEVDIYVPKNDTGRLIQIVDNNNELYLNTNNNTEKI